MQKLWRAIKENWLAATIASVALAVAGIVAFLSGLAAIWTVMSRDTVPEFLEKRGWLSGWSVTTPVVAPLIQVLASMGVLLVLVGLWREAKRQRNQKNTQAVLSSDYPVPSLLIHSAKYGVGEGQGEYVDVTEPVRDEVRDSELRFAVHNETLGVENPFKGRQKKLWVTYSITQKVEVEERNELLLPPHRTRRTLQVDHPSYVANGEWQGSSPEPPFAKLPIGTDGRIIVDVTDRPEARTGDVYDPKTGIFTRPEAPRTNTEPNPEAERNARELERAARDLEHPKTLAQSFRQHLSDEADDLREAARRLREKGAQQTDLMETSFSKASRLLENIAVEWRKTDSNLMVNVTNKNHDVVIDFELWVEEPVRKSGSAFAQQKEFQDYQPLRLVGGSNRLYHDQPESFPFLSYATERLYFTGHAPDNPSGQGNFRTLGIWKVTFRAVIDGMPKNHELFFNWDNLRKIFPTPCDSEGNALG